MKDYQKLENNLLGTCITDPGKFYQACDYIHSHMVFRSQFNRTIWKTMQAMDADGIPIEITTISAQLSKAGLDKTAGLDRLLDLTEFTTPVTNIQHHCLLVMEDFLRRESAGIGTALKNYSEDAGKDIFDTIEDSTLALEQLTGTLVQGKPESFGDISPSRIEEAEDRTERRKEADRTGEQFTDGIPCGIDDLDEILNGAKGGQLIIVGGRPGMGKSAYTANNVCIHAAAIGHPCAFFSLEMPKGELVDRMLCAGSGVSYGKYQKGYLTPIDVEKLKATRGKMKNYPLYVIDSGASSITKIRSAARKYKREFGIEMIVIDNLNLIDGKGYNRENEVANTTKGLKRLSIELDIPVVLICHLNRGCESRDIKEPILSDLRDSGAIEQDADSVVFLYRPGYYGKRYYERAHADLYQSLLQYYQNTAEAEKVMEELSFGIVAKNRGLRTGKTPIRFIGRFTRFEKWEDENLRELLDLAPINSPVTKFEVPVENGIPTFKDNELPW